MRLATLLSMLLGCGGPLRLLVDDPPSPIESGTATALHSADAPPGSVDALLEGLRSRGLEPDEGALSWETVDDCCVWGDCLLTNEGSDYATWALPPSPGEYLGDRVPDVDGRLRAWRFGEDEGALYVGPPPPGARYTSFRAYVHDRDDGAGGRTLALVNLGDSLNGAAWQLNPDGTLLVLTTGSQALTDRVRAAAAQNGWPAVNLDALPPGYVRLGLDASADTFHTTLRVVGFDDRPAFESWRDEPRARVFKLRATDALPREPVTAPPIRPAEAAPALGTAPAVAELRQAVLDAHPGWGVVDAVVTPLEPPLDPAEGEDFCWSGCNRDVSYDSTPGVVLLPRDRLVVYGVDPVGADHATWTEIMLAGALERDAAGHAGTEDLRGSGAAWLPGARPELYAYTFARDCTGVPFCSEVPYTCPGLAAAELGSVLWRTYLDPVTATWPPHEGLGERGAVLLRAPN